MSLNDLLHQPMDPILLLISSVILVLFILIIGAIIKLLDLVGNKIIKSVWNEFPKTSPNNNGWYIVTCIVPLASGLDEYVTYTRSLYWNGNKWIDKCVDHIFKDLNVYTRGSEYNIHAPGKYLYSDDKIIKDNIDQTDIVCAWKEYGDPFIKKGVKYYSTTNRCDLHPEGYPYGLIR